MSKRCDYCGREGTLEYRYTYWYETIHNGGGPATYQIGYETEGYFCKDVHDDEDESCWERHLKEIDNEK